ILVTTTPSNPEAMEEVAVGSATEMLTALTKACADADVLVMAAAVADYAPEQVAASKLRRTDRPMDLHLRPNVDILKTLGPRPGLYRVGFAAETEDLRAQAQQKLGAKQLDMIVANQVGVDGQGLASDFNAVTIVTPSGVAADVPRLPKSEVAGRIWDAMPVLPSPLVEVAGFVAAHYLVPLDEVIRAIVPPRVRAVVHRSVKRRRQSRILRQAAAVSVPEAIVLEPAQQAVRERIAIALSRQESGVFLLPGVTGRGKTEVYLALLEQVLAGGGQGLVLVPEIALTPQTVGRFAARFPGRLAVLHSALTEAERAAEWWRIRRGEADIVIG